MVDFNKLLDEDASPVTPHLVPIDLIPSFAKAKRRFFLSATLIDDSILLKEFGVAKEAATTTIRPPIVGDIGERMVLAPSLIDKNLEPEIPGLCKKIAERGYNVVVLVPSFKAGDRWANAGAIVVPKDDVGATVEKLRASKGNYVVLANRYDGIDLPDDACRVLVLDGVPAGESHYEQHITSVRSDSALVTGSGRPDDRAGPRPRRALGKGLLRRTPLRLAPRPVRGGKGAPEPVLAGNQAAVPHWTRDREAGEAGHRDPGREAN
jgi:hypothetical protein